MIRTDFREMDAEYLEAENTRYGPTAFLIMPLSSGRIVVLGHMRALHAIVDTLEEAIEASKTIEFLQWRKAVESKKAPTAPINLDLDLDL